MKGEPGDYPILESPCVQPSPEEIIDRAVATLALLAAVAALASACDDSSQRQASKTGASGSAAASVPNDRLQQLVASNATVIGYLYTPDKPYAIASFSNGTLQWRADPKSPPVAQGTVAFFTEPDKDCLGFEHKNVSMPGHGPERYLVCEATRTIQHSNSLPRSQDFNLDSGTLFMEYEPPAGTGFVQYYYAAVTQQALPQK